MSDITPTRPPTSGAGGVSRQGGQNRPQRPPRTDAFKKLAKDRRSSDDDDENMSVAETEQDETDSNKSPSLFDLSRDKPKDKSAALPKAFQGEEGLEDAAALESTPSTPSSVEMGSKMRIPAKEQPTEYLIPSGEDVPSTDQEPDQDLAALTAKKTGSQPQQMTTTRREDRDQRLFENVLAKTTDEILPEDPLAAKMKQKNKEGISTRFVADTESGKERVKTKLTGDDEGTGMLSEYEEPVDPLKSPGEGSKGTPGAGSKGTTNQPKSIKQTTEEMSSVPVKGPKVLKRADSTDALPKSVKSSQEGAKTVEKIPEFGMTEEDEKLVSDEGTSFEPKEGKTGEKPRSQTPATPTKIKEKIEESMEMELGANEVGRQQADQVQAMKSKRTDTPANRAEEAMQVTKKEKPKGGSGSRSGSDDAERNPNFAAANPIQTAGMGSDRASIKDTQDVSRTTTIKQIVAQIVEKIQVMRDNDSTKTIVTLKHPPILAGATVTLTASDNAKQEFNISFANLSPDAKMFLDRKLNEDSLTQTLERKGIVVHMVTTTTQTEIMNIQSGQPSKEDQQQQQREQSQQQQQREREQQQEEEENQ